MEKWDIYDSERKLTGEMVIRGETMKSGDLHLVIHVCVFNAKGQMLVQQRQPFKKGWSNLWDITVGGSALAGESSYQAAERESKEEIGLSLDLSNHRPSFTVNFEQGFDDYYLINTEVELSELVLQYEEVQAVKWASREEILHMIENKEFVPYYSSLINMIFDMGQNLGSFPPSVIEEM